MTTTTTTFRDAIGQTRLQAAANALILGLWLWLYWPVVRYLGIIFSREDFRTNQILLLGVLLLIAQRIRASNGRFHPSAAPQPRPLPLALVLISSIAYLLVERYLDINTIAAALFGAASYGLLGLWLTPARWRRGLPAALLLIGVLPFGDHLQTFVGYPMRIATASLVGSGLQKAGVASMGLDTILIFENGVAQVDLPCSGVKSLWTGALFLIAATWIENRRLNGRWLFIALTFAALLFLANLARVAILVAVGMVWGMTLLAEMLHVPLGILGFVAACVVAVALLRRLKIDDQRLMINDQRLKTADQASALIINHQSFPLTALLIAIILTFALLYTPRPATAVAAHTAAYTFPAELAVTPLPLKPDENEWLNRDGATAADRYQFQYGELKGTMILITSETWRAHHRPERCFEVYGLSLDDSRTHLVRPDFSLRMVALGDGNGRSLVSASYWFQSATQTTDDYGSRIWADVAPQRDRWVLVSIVFTDLIDPTDAEAAAFYETLQTAVSTYLTQ